MATAPKNRIVGHEVIDSKDLQANPLNWRRHPKRQKKVLKALLEQIGIVDEALVNRRTGRLVNGHKRVMLYDAAGLETVHAAILDLTEEEERLALATLDPIAEMAEADAATLDALLHQTETGHADLQALAADLAAENGLYAETPEPADPDGTEDFDPDTSLDQYGVIVPCRDEDHNEAVYQALLAEGYNCKVVVT